ncbi:hypothetical protein HDU99_000722, partial [Rhizoclosmatium hyalinum]
LPASSLTQNNPFGLPASQPPLPQTPSSEKKGVVPNKDSIMSLFNAPPLPQTSQTVYVPVTMVGGMIQQPGMVMMQQPGMQMQQQQQQQQPGIMQQQPMYSTFTSASSQNSPMVPRSTNGVNQQQPQPGQPQPIVNGQFQQQQRNHNPFA